MENSMTNIRNYNPDDGDLCQGDVIIFRLPDGYITSRDNPIAPRDNKLILAEGEVTGHHHAIWCNPTMFRDDAMARSLEDAIPAEAVQAASASLYRDDALTQRLDSDGHLTTTALAIGYLTVEGEPVVLRHEEHDPIRIPPGEYYVGRQREFHSGEARKIAD